MAVRAYVLIETQIGRTKEVVKAVSSLYGVVLVDSVTGPYDAIATVEGKTLNDVGDLVTAKLHPISGILRTVTCLAVTIS